MNTEEDYIVEKLAGSLLTVNSHTKKSERFLEWVRYPESVRRDETYEEWKARKDQE